jgi:hypothetical protein
MRVIITNVDEQTVLQCLIKESNEREDRWQKTATEMSTRNCHLLHDVQSLTARYFIINSKYSHHM